MFLISILLTWADHCGKFILKWPCVADRTVAVEVLLYVHRNRRFIRDRSPGRPPRLSHSSWALLTEHSDPEHTDSLTNHGKQVLMSIFVAHFRNWTCNAWQRPREKKKEFINIQRINAVSAAGKKERKNSVNWPFVVGTDNSNTKKGFILMNIIVY